MPVVRDQYDSMNTVHPIFEMNLPEGALLEKLRLRFAKVTPDFDDLALLEIVGHSQIGRLRFVRAGATPHEPPPEDLTKLLTYQGAEDLFADLLERYAAYSGVSGMQPKVLVRAGEGPLGHLAHKSTTHLVKSFDPKEYPELAANEYFCTRLASHAGLSVPKLALSENRRLLLAERFDLNGDGSYFGMEDFCVLNALRANGRYDGSYENVAKRIREFVSPEHVAPSLQQLFLTVAVCCAIENGDAHLKNFAVLYDNPEGAVRLAPAYDLVCTTLYSPRDSMALTLGDSKAFPSREALSAFAVHHCDLPSSIAAKLVTNVLAATSKATEEVRAYARQHTDFERAAAHLIDRFDHGNQRLRGTTGHRSR
jgi:serine/threonine-protein kinase HipA